MVRAQAGDRLRVGIVGAGGRMGRLLCAGVAADPQLALVAAIGRSHADMPIGALVAGVDLDLRVSNRLETLLDERVDVAVDFTGPHCVAQHARWYVEHRLCAVIGATGLTPSDIDEIGARAKVAGANIVVAPNLSLTGALMLHAVSIAARHLDEVELLEVHHPTKVDAPSGTATAQAREMARVREGRPASTGKAKETSAGARGAIVSGIHVHTLKLSGLVGLVEARFAHRGDTLAIGVANHSRDNYVAGALLALKAAPHRPGLTLGFESILGLASEGRREQGR